MLKRIIVFIFILAFMFAFIVEGQFALAGKDAKGDPANAQGKAPGSITIHQGSPGKPTFNLDGNDGVPPPEITIIKEDGTISHPGPKDDGGYDVPGSGDGGGNI